MPCYCNPCVSTVNFLRASKQLMRDPVDQVHLVMSGLWFSSEQ